MRRSIPRSACRCTRWVVPSIVTGLVAAGRELCGAMEYGPAPGMLKTITSGTVSLLASRIACRKEPAPLSFVLVTVKVVANADMLPRPSQIASPAAKPFRNRKAFLSDVISLLSLPLLDRHFPPNCPGPMNRFCPARSDQVHSFHSRGANRFTHQNSLCPDHVPTEAHGTPRLTPARSHKVRPDSVFNFALLFTHAPWKQKPDHRDLFSILKWDTWTLSNAWTLLSCSGTACVEPCSSCLAPGLTFVFLRTRSALHPAAKPVGNTLAQPRFARFYDVG